MRIYANTIITGIRVLAEHHIALQHPFAHFKGIIDTQFNPKKLITRVAETVEEICEYHYNTFLELVFNGDTDTTFPYIPGKYTF